MARNPYGYLRSNVPPEGMNFRRHEVVRPVILGSNAILDLSDSTLRAMLDQQNPATNNYQYAAALQSSSDRTGVDVFYAQSMIYSVPDGIVGALVAGFSARVGNLLLSGQPNGLGSPSPSFTCAVRFYEDEIDPQTIVWNDRAGLTLLQAFTFNNDIITSFTEAGSNTDIEFTKGGDDGAYMSVFAEPSVGLNARTIRAVEILLDAPGCIDPTTAQATFSAAISSPLFLLGDDG